MQRILRFLFFMLLVMERHRNLARMIFCLARLTLVSLLLVGFWPRSAQAHHPVPSQSGALQQLSWFSQSYQQPRTRILVSQGYQALRSSLNHGHSFTTSVLAQVALRPWLFVDLQSRMLTLVQPQRDKPSQTGLGNSRIALSSVWPMPKSIDRDPHHSWKIIHTLSLSLPTRTITYVVDPGPTWIATASILAQYERGWLDLQLFHQAVFETRPSGLALDLGLAASLGRTFASSTRIGLGGLLDLRAGNWCNRLRGSMYQCPTGRSTEVDRRVGATRLYTLLSFDAQISQKLSLGIAFFSPISDLRDFDIRSELRLQLSFG